MVLLPNCFLVFSSMFTPVTVTIAPCRTISLWTFRAAFGAMLSTTGGGPFRWVPRMVSACQFMVNVLVEPFKVLAFVFLLQGELFGNVLVGIHFKLVLAPFWCKVFWICRLYSPCLMKMV
jgi:hypothetical protein